MYLASFLYPVLIRFTLYPLPSIPAFAFGLSMGIAFLNQQFEAYRKGLGLKVSMIGAEVIDDWVNDGGSVVDWGWGGIIDN